VYEIKNKTAGITLLTLMCSLHQDWGVHKIKTKFLFQTKHTINII